MIHEFRANRQRVFRIDPQQDGALVVTAEYEKESTGKGALQRRTPVQRHEAWGEWERHSHDPLLPPYYTVDGYRHGITTMLIVSAQWILGALIIISQVRGVLVSGYIRSNAAVYYGFIIAILLLRERASRIAATYAVSSWMPCLHYYAKSGLFLSAVGLSVAGLVELVAPLLPFYVYVLMMLITSMTRGILMEVTEGSLHVLCCLLPVRGNEARDKKSPKYLGNAAAVTSLFLTMAVHSYTPSASHVGLLTMHAGVSLLSIGASYRLCRTVTLPYLNPPRLELCLARFYADESARLVPLQKHLVSEASAPAAAERRREEALVTPAEACAMESVAHLPPVGTHSRTWLAHLYRHVSALMRAPMVSVTFGASLYVLMSTCSTEETVVKQNLVNAVESSLSSRGVALLYDAVKNTYAVLMLERFSAEGSPMSWQKPEAPEPYPIRQWTTHSVFHTDERSAVVRRFLWAYFYAYSHQRSRVREGGRKASPVATPSSSLYVVQALRADGTYDADGQKYAHHFTELQDGNLSAHGESADFGADELYNAYVSFVTALEKSGWQLDCYLPCPVEGWTIAVHYL